MEGWVNIDYEPRTEKSFYFDALDGLPIADNSVRHIHCEHFLEHLEFADAVLFLGECYRVLEPSGSMRIIVPDAERYMRAYCDNDEQFFAKLINLGNHPEPLIPKNRVCNHSFRFWGLHRFAWDFETLEHTARDLKFAQIVRSQLNNIEPDYRIDGQDWWRPLESLYANLRKDS
jgi:predicted SAM-dependent methyltransferase